MISQHERDLIVALLKREVVPAIGCTEPIAVALCVAKVAETLGKKPEKISVKLSANILKNAMGVGIPGTGGMIGLPISVALGALIGKSEYGLEVLRDCTPEAVEEGKRMIDAQTIDIELKSGIEEKLYIEAVASAGDDTARAIISGGHTHFVYVALNADVLLDEQNSSSQDAGCEEDVVLSLRKIYEFAMTAPMEDISFILESGRVNKRAAEHSFKGDYGHALGKTLMSSKSEMLVMGGSTFSHIIAYTSAACDARMAGEMVPIMTTAGSGNLGISATLPVVVYAEEKGKSEEELTRALIVSQLIAIYMKQNLGRLSAVCGCVVAAAGSSCAITYLMGGKYDHMVYAVQNMIANLTGVICDGAKPSCAMKLTSGIATAVLSAILAMENRCATSVEGIIEDNVELSIRNLTKIGTEGMNVTDSMILDMMTHKHCNE